TDVFEHVTNPGKILKESDIGLFNLFREWRAKRSRKEGVPPYVLFTNNQLVQIVIKRPQSMAELSKIEGIGKAKLEKYGQEILEISKIEMSEGTEKK
ncbi:MAG: HRDC domain-containing protein, partial [Deltaproteobacteria bacterium]